MGLFRCKPWLWIVLGFLVLITAWSVLVSIALHHRPESIDIHAHQRSSEEP